MVLAAAISAVSSSSVAELSSFLQRQLELIQQSRGALRAWTIAVAVKFLDLQLQMSDQRLIIGLLSSGRRGLRASNNQCRFQRVNVVWQSFETSIHEC